MDIEAKLTQLGIKLPAAPVPLGNYVPAKLFGGRFVQTSGCVPNANGSMLLTGRVGAEITEEQGREAAKVCVLNALAAVSALLEGLSRVRSVVKLTAFVAGAEGFYRQPAVADAASALLAEIFGAEDGKSARSAVGVSALPGNAPVEIEILFEIE